MLTIYQVIMILIGLAMLIRSILNRIKYAARCQEMGDPMEQGDIWSRRRRHYKTKKDYEYCGKELEKVRQERGRRMREFNKKREKLASKTKDRQDYLINGKDEKHSVALVEDRNVEEPLICQEQGESLDNMLLGEGKVVVEYDDTKSTTHLEYSKTLADRLDPRDTILRQRPTHFKIDEKPLSWTI